jgi:hypothetical protein
MLKFLLNYLIELPFMNLLIALPKHSLTTIEQQLK